MSGCPFAPGQAVTWGSHAGTVLTVSPAGHSVRVQTELGVVLAFRFTSCQTWARCGGTWTLEG